MTTPMRPGKILENTRHERAGSQAPSAPEGSSVSASGRAAHTPGPWRYRPHRHDDWGWIRGSTPDADGFCPLVAIARSGKLDTEAELDEHRANKTDPFETNGRLITLTPEMLEALEIIVANARVQPDTLMSGSTDIYAVPLEDIEAARKLIDKARGQS